MQKIEEVETGQARSVLPSKVKPLLVIFRRASLWLAGILAPNPARSRRFVLAAMSAIFLLALGVRLLHWQDSRTEMMARGGPWNSGIARYYKQEAGRIREEGGILFPRGAQDPGDARLIIHPPGYGALVAAIFALAGEDDSNVILLQVLLDSLSATLIFLIAAELLAPAAAIIAGLLVAFSPHFAYYSLWFSPDTLPVLPVLAAVYLIIRASKRPRLVTVLVAGAMIGLSCWLRANGLLLAPFLAAAAMLQSPKGERLKYGAALIGAAVIVVSPITIRNFVLYHRFIPVSVDGGLALVEGIADYDEESRFDMPRVDREAPGKDVEWHNRPDYAVNIWSPDGIEREDYRFRRGVDVITSHPFWFAGVMARRAMFMLTYDKPPKNDWPFNTVNVPLVSAEQKYGHDYDTGEQAQTVWAASGEKLAENGATLAPGSQAMFRADKQTLEITGDDSEYADQFAAAPVQVDKNSDYLLKLSIRFANGPAAVKVTSADRRIMLSSAIVSDSEKIRRGKNKTVQTEENSATDFVAQPASEIALPFSSGNRSEVLLVISNNGPSTVPPVMAIEQASLYKMGPTPYVWTKIIRPSVRGLQRNLYTTSRMLPLVIIGILLLAVARHKTALLILLVVPVYYLSVHSVFHTEYRYILGIHYFLFIMAAVAVYLAGKLIGQGVLMGKRRWSAKA